MAIGALVPFRLVADQKNLQPFQWITGNLVFSFDVQAGKLRQKRLLPSGSLIQQDNSSGVEVALQCSGENSPDQGMKSGIGQPGARLLFAGYREEYTDAGKLLICTHTDSLLNLHVDSVYEGFDGVPVVRRRQFPFIRLECLMSPIPRLQLLSGCELENKLCWEPGGWMVRQPREYRGRTRSLNSFTRVILESKSRPHMEHCRSNSLEAAWPACLLLIRCALLYHAGAKEQYQSESC